MQFFLGIFFFCAFFLFDFKPQQTDPTNYLIQLLILHFAPTDIPITITHGLSTQSTHAASFGMLFRGDFLFIF